MIGMDKLWIKKLIESDSRLGELDPSIQLDLIQDVLESLSFVYGREKNFYWRDGENPQLVLRIWISSLTDYSVRVIYETIQAIIEGRTASATFPPNAMEFHGIQKSLYRSLKSIEELGVASLPHQRTPKELEKSKTSFDEIRRVLGMK